MPGDVLAMWGIAWNWDNSPLACVDTIMHRHARRKNAPGITFSEDYPTKRDPKASTETERAAFYQKQAEKSAA